MSWTEEKKKKKKFFDLLKLNLIMDFLQYMKSEIETSCLHKLIVTSTMVVELSFFALVLDYTTIKPVISKTLSD